MIIKSFNNRTVTFTHKNIFIVSSEKVFTKLSLLKEML